MKHIRDVTVIKNAFPKEWKDDYMKLLETPNSDWIRYPTKHILYEGPKISNTALGDKWRNYAFAEWKDMFGIEYEPKEDLIMKDNIYWGDFILQFKEDHYLAPHYDKYNPDEFRFNVLLQKPIGGGLYNINKKTVPLEEGDMVVFAPYHNLHQTDKIIGNRNRVVLSLCFRQNYIKGII